MRKRWLVGGVVVVVAAAGGVVALKGGSGASAVPVSASMAAAKPDAKEEPPLDFTVAEASPAKLMALPQRIEFSGALVAPNTAMVRAKATGTLLQLDVQEGDHVHAGQSLGRIDVSDLASRVAERSANLVAAQATLAQAQRTHTSNQGLANDKFISPIALDNSRAALETAQAQVGAAQASLDSTRVALRDAALIAPISGVVSKRHVVPGEKVIPEQQVVTIVDLHLLELAGTVGTQEVSKLAPGMPVEVRIEGVTDPVHGKLARINPAAEPGTRSIGVAVRLQNPTEALRAGEYAVATVQLGDAQPRLTVPLGAISVASGQEYVWTVEKGVLMRRTVTSGRRDPAQGRVEILEGLKPDAPVLGARFDNLREGAKARIVANAAAAKNPAVVVR
jgi:RND family efflux transporter MFP subunit